MYLNAVRYSTERATLNLSLIKDLENDHEYLRFYEDNFLMKSIEWAYEREYRRMIDDRHSEVAMDKCGKEIRFWRFKPEHLRYVDLGFGIGGEEEKQILELTEARYPQVKVRRIQMCSQGYSFGLKTLN